MLPTYDKLLTTFHIGHSCFKTYIYIQLHAYLGHSCLKTSTSNFMHIHLGHSCLKTSTRKFMHISATLASRHLHATSCISRALLPQDILTQLDAYLLELSWIFFNVASRPICSIFSETLFWNCSLAIFELSSILELSAILRNLDLKSRLENLRMLYLGPPCNFHCTRANEITSGCCILSK